MRPVKALQTWMVQARWRTALVIWLCAVTGWLLSAVALGHTITLGWLLGGLVVSLVYAALAFAV